jgi:hypothetical protein
MWATWAVVSMDAALIAIRILKQVFILKSLNPVLADLTNCFKMFSAMVHQNMVGKVK